MEKSQAQLKIMELFVQYLEQYGPDETVNYEIDEETGLPVYHLYG